MWLSSVGGLLGILPVERENLRPPLRIHSPGLKEVFREMRKQSLVGILLLVTQYKKINGSYRDSNAGPLAIELRFP